MILDDFGTSIYMPHAPCVAGSGSFFTACQGCWKCELKHNAQKLSSRRGGFPAAFSGGSVLSTTALGVSNSSNTVYVVSSLWNVFAQTCDLQIPSGSKKMTAVHSHRPTFG